MLELLLYVLSPSSQPWRWNGQVLGHQRRWVLTCLHHFTTEVLTFSSPLFIPHFSLSFSSSSLLSFFYSSVYSSSLPFFFLFLPPSIPPSLIPPSSLPSLPSFFSLFLSFLLPTPPSLDCIYFCLLPTLLSHLSLHLPPISLNASVVHLKLWPFLQLPGLRLHEIGNSRGTTVT